MRITLRYTQKIIKEDLQLVKNCDKPFNPDLEVLETHGNQDPSQCSFWTSRVVFKRQGVLVAALIVLSMRQAVNHAVGLHF